MTVVNACVMKFFKGKNIQKLNKVTDPFFSPRGKKGPNPNFLSAISCVKVLG